MTTKKCFNLLTGVALLFFLLLVIVGGWAGTSYADVDTFEGQTGDTWEGQAGTDTIEGQPVASAPAGDPCGCDTETYQAVWTGDYSGDGGVICYNSGASTKEDSATTLTIGTTHAVAGNGAIVDADEDENITWVVASDDIIDNAQGTAWASFYCDDEWPNTQIIITAWDSTDPTNDYMVLEIDDSDKLKIVWKGNGSSGVKTGTGASITADGTTRIGFSWKVAGAETDRICVKVAGDADWQCREGELGVASTFNRFAIGHESDVSGDSNTNDGGTIDNVIITTGYQDTDSYAAE